VIHGKGAPEEELGDEVAVRHSQQRVWNHATKVELLGQELTVNLEWIACQGATSYQIKRECVSSTVLRVKKKVKAC